MHAAACSVSLGQLHVGASGSGGSGCVFPCRWRSSKYRSAIERRVSSRRRDGRSFRHSRERRVADSRCGRRHGTPLCAAQRARPEGLPLRLRPRAVRRLHGPGGRQPELRLHPSGVGRLGEARHDRRGPRHCGASAPAAAGLPRRAGRAMWLLPVGHPHLRGRVARQESESEPGRRGGGPGAAPVPLWRPQPHRARRAARGDGAPRRGGAGMIPNTLPKSLVDNPRLDAWVAFESGGKVRVATGKVELGQGIVTALAQIAAEELDVAPERLRIVSGDTGHSPNEGYTAGSLSVEGSGAAIRLACAEVRHLFVARAAEALGVEPESMAVEDGRFLRDGVETGFDYWTLAPQIDLSRDATGSAPAKSPASFRIVGTSQPRLDLPEKLFGAPFAHDLAPPGLLHARVLHRPWGGARLASLDEARLRRAAKGAFEILRDGDFLAFVAEDEA